MEIRIADSPLLGDQQKSTEDGPDAVGAVADGVA